MMQERMVTLHTGEIVSNHSEKWRLECEAIALLQMRDKAARHDHLFGAVDPKTGLRKGGIAGKRGRAAAERLQATAMSILNSRQSGK